jgi:Bacterial Ig domain/Right handed beta helix region
MTKHVKFGLALFVACALQPLDAASQSGRVVEITPSGDIGAAVNSAPPGTTFTVHAGTYRLQAPIAAKTGDVFHGEPGAVLSGARLLTGFRQEGPNFFVDGQTQRHRVNVEGPKCLPDYPRCGYPEDLYFDDKPLRHVDALSELGPGKWYFDYDHSRIYFADDPAGHVVETSVAPAAFQPGPANRVTVEGLVIEKFATPVMTGAVGGAGTGLGSPDRGADWTIRNCEIRFNHGDGIRVNFGWQILNNNIHHNGNLGIGGGVGGGGANGHGDADSHILIQGNEVAFNNYAHVNPKFGAGGIKIVKTRGLILRGNNSHDNVGSGIHLDINNYNALYDGNTVADNTDQGIFHEISYSAVVRNNKLLRNGSIYPNGTYWLYAANLLSSTSQGVEAYCNTIEVSAQGGNGADMLAQHRGDAVPSTGNYFHHNTVIFDGNSGVTGGARERGIDDFFSANRFDYNSYYLPDPSRRAFAWNDKMNTFAQFQAAGEEAHGAAGRRSPNPPPDVVISSPADQSRISDTVDVQGQVSDSTSIKQIELYVDWTLRETVHDSPFSFTLNATDLPDGPHVIAAMAYSRDGLRSCYAISVTK